MKFLDLTNQKFGRLMALHRVDGKPTRWFCKCDCGTEKAVLLALLRDGRAVSCGCFNRENQAKLHMKHGHCPHYRPTLTYRIWQSVLKRCEDSKQQAFANYGARGITVCQEWHSFAAFLRDMGECPPGLSIDRKDNGGNYEPSNCRWATRKEQGRNKKNNVLVLHAGKRIPMSAYAEVIGIDYWAARSKARKENLILSDRKE